MKKDIDSLLREALSPDREPEPSFQEKILQKWDDGDSNLLLNARRRNEMGIRRKISAAAAAAVCVAAVSVTAAAGVKYLSTDEIITQMRNKDATNVFEMGNVLEINQKQEAGDYVFTLYSIATKEMLEESGLGEPVKTGDRDTYAIVSIERKDGSPMPSTDSAEYGDLSFFVSPLIQGLKPWEYNAASMRGAYGEMERNGILYRILECDDIAIFADRELYLCITDTTFYCAEAYDYNEDDGTIAPNESYEGINVLFELPIDKALADADKAAEYIAGMEGAKRTKETPDAALDGTGTFLQGEKYAEISDKILEDCRIVLARGNINESSVAEYLDKLIQGEYTEEEVEGFLDLYMHGSVYDEVTGSTGCEIADRILKAEWEKGSQAKSIGEIPLETLLGYAELDEDSVKEATVDENGILRYSYFSEEKGGWSIESAVEYVFPEGSDLVLNGSGCSIGEGMHSMTLDVFRRDEDGTIKGMTYHIKK